MKKLIHAVFSLHTHLIDDHDGLRIGVRIRIRARGSAAIWEVGGG